MDQQSDTSSSGQGTVAQLINGASHSNVFIRPVPHSWLDEDGSDKARSFFSAFGEVDSVRIQTGDSATQSSHAFIHFTSTEAASNAIQSLQGSLIEGTAVLIKLADADMAPRIQSGLTESSWCYCRGLPANLTKPEIAAIFASYGPVQDIKHFPSTEVYRGSGALVQFENTDHATAAIQALNGAYLPNSTQPLLVRYADSPQEKAAKAARKERLNQRAGLNPMMSPFTAPDQLQQQLIELSLKTGNPLAAASLMTRNSSNDSSWPLQQMSNPSNIPLGKTHAGQGCSIYIKGMPDDADKLWLYEKFSRFGGVLSVRVLLDEQSGKCNGIGFVNFTDPEAARAAHETMNGVNMGERLLHVMVQNSGGRERFRTGDGGGHHGPSNNHAGMVTGHGIPGYMGMDSTGMPAALDAYGNVQQW